MEVNEGMPTCRTMNENHLQWTAILLQKPNYCCFLRSSDNMQIEPASGANVHMNQRLSGPSDNGSTHLCGYYQGLNSGRFMSAHRVGQLLTTDKLSKLGRFQHFNLLPLRVKHCGCLD